MSAWSLARLMRRTGRITEQVDRPGGASDPDRDTGHPDVSVPEGFSPPRALRGSIQIRHVDAGSCNGCEIELSQVFGPVYDAEQYGARLVASPRHADMVLVTGVVTRNMSKPLRLTVEATPCPRMVCAVGDCAVSGGLFAEAYGVDGPVDSTVPVDVRVTGCPPEPAAIIAALRAVTGR